VVKTVRPIAGRQDLARHALVLCALVGLLAGCGKQPAAGNKALSNSGADACQLLSREEVQQVQGSPVNDSKSSENSSSGMRTLQCFYSATQPDKSVSLAVMTADGSASKPQSPIEFWEKTFGPYEPGAPKEAEHEERGEGERDREEKEKNPPKKIEGVGDEAFWSSTHVGGALYVLKKSSNAFLRISVGGPDPENAKIEKSKNLALKALLRL